MKFDSNAKYRESHEWVRKDGSLIVAGISDHAQAALGDIVFVELPEVGKSYKQGETFGVIESVKAASDMYMPMSGTITEVNEDLAGAPDLVNKDAFGSGWLIKFTPSNASEYDSLLSSKDYEASCKE